MSMQRTVSIIAAILLVTSLAPAALAQTNTLGIGENDVRDDAPNAGTDLAGTPVLDVDILEPAQPSV